MESLESTPRFTLETTMECVVVVFHKDALGDEKLLWSKKRLKYGRARQVFVHTSPDNFDFEAEPYEPADFAWSIRQISPGDFTNVFMMLSYPRHCLPSALGAVIPRTDLMMLSL
jgi:hypothetical protein